jgi:uncharacterized protein (TIGR02147 family)
MVFDYRDYKKWVNDRIAAMPKGGRGQYMRIVESLGTSSAIVTQIFKGDRDLTAEQAVLLSDHFGLSKVERQYFLLLVNYSRAGSHRYKKILEEEITEFQIRAREIKSRVPQDKELTEEAKAILYSNWYYLAIWSLTAIPGFETIDVITERLQISRTKANQALEFLEKHGLVKSTNGKLSIGATLIHLESASPNIPRHHQNWRGRAFLKYENLGTNDVAYTAPITLSKKDAEVMRERVLTFVSDTLKLVKDSPSEELHCLCLDWFRV